MVKRLSAIVGILSTRIQDWAFYSGVPLAREQNSALLGRVGRLVFAARPATTKNKDSMRMLVDTLQPVAPLTRKVRPRKRKNSLPEIEILVAAVEKDLDLLRNTLEAAQQFSQNPISRVRVVVPRQSLQRAQETLASMAEVVAEEAFLPPEIRRAVSRFATIGRKGWVTQQFIGLYGAWSSPSRGVLVLDSDTLLAGDRVWLTESLVQTLSFSYEYHEPYEVHATRVWGKRRRYHFLSFVTHYMLMQPDIVKEMFPALGDFVRWADLADLRDFSGLADYHCYGRWITDNLPHRITFERWSNISADFGQPNSSTRQKIATLKELHPHARSFSSHSWARRPHKETPHP